MLTAERVRELLHYNPDTGLLTWKKSNSNRAKIGSVVKCRSHGYLVARIDGKLYPAHRLVFLYMMGRFPEHDVDHVDGNRSNNVWSNLREATRQQNMRNKIAQPSASGIKGVCRIAGGKWRARITVDRQSYHLGCFLCAEDAKAAYAQAAHKYFGAFARLT